MLAACRADIGCTATVWLEARDRLRRELARHKSVNLVVPAAGVLWDTIVSDLSDGAYSDLAIVDLHDGRTEYRDGLLSRILAKVGLLELAKQLGNVTQACKMMGYSRDSFYRFRELYEKAASWRCRSSRGASRT